MRFALGLIAACSLALFTAADPAPTKSALEADPSGWTDLFKDAGPELKGWTRATLYAKDTLNADNQWAIDTSTGIITCAGDKGHEWLRWEQEVGDFIYHVEWRFTPVTTGKKGYNSGIYARNSKDATTWIQAQTGPGPAGWLVGDSPKNGKLTHFDLNKKATAKPVKPPGEWNTFEVTCKGPEVRLWINGFTTNEWTDCETLKGYVGLEAEGYRIEFRKVMLKPL